jgi:hypothetical protein
LYEKFGYHNGLVKSINYNYGVLHGEYLEYQQPHVFSFVFHRRIKTNYNNGLLDGIYEEQSQNFYEYYNYRLGLKSGEFILSTKFYIDGKLYKLFGEYVNNKIIFAYLYEKELCELKLIKKNNIDDSYIDIIENTKKELLDKKHIYYGFY